MSEFVACPDCVLAPCLLCRQPVLAQNDALTVKFLAYRLNNPALPRTLYQGLLARTQHLLPVPPALNKPACPGHVRFASYVRDKPPLPIPDGYDFDLAAHVKGAYQHLQRALQALGQDANCMQHGRPLNGLTLLDRMRPDF